MYKYLPLLLLLSGCPIETDIPDVPTKAVCSDDRFLFDENGTAMLNPEGGALTCDLK